MSRDGPTTSTALESTLWKAVMLEMYGSEWARLASEAEEAAAAEAADAPSLPSKPGLVPAAGADSPGQVTPPSAAARVEVSPGSGEIATAAAGPGSGYACTFMVQSKPRNSYLSYARNIERLCSW
jgi:hypothetical protein